MKKKTGSLILCYDIGGTKIAAALFDSSSDSSRSLLAYSTSGVSPNCLRAVEQAREMGIHSVALTGRAGGTLAEASGIALKAPAILTARVQECHATIGHALCLVVERALCGDS